LVATIMAAGRQQEVIDVEYIMRLPALIPASAQSSVAAASVDARSWCTGLPMATAAAFARHGVSAGMAASTATSARDAFLPNGVVASNRVKHPLPRDPWHG
jgi:hypothetical protein